MGEILTTDEYFAAVANATRYVFDKKSNKNYQLRKLFFLQRFADGQYAFTRYQELLEKSDTEYKQGASPEIERMRQILRKYSADKEHADERPSLYDARAVYKTESIAEILLSNIASALDSNQYKSQKEKTDNCLFEEPSRSFCNKLLFSDPLSSRVIVMANAGFGKTTLISRIALAMSDSGSCVSEEELDEDRSFLMSVEDNDLPRAVPCVISLRDCNADIDVIGDIDSLIRDSVSSMLQNEKDSTAIKDWLLSARKRLVLLIDGLDELPNKSVMPFLSGLEEYLTVHTTTRVIITTRVSGIDNDAVKDKLRRLKFHGRTILPLNDCEAKQFCEQWVEETQGSPDLLKSLERIQTESQLSYLREFIRKPLELIMLLQYLPHQSYASFNRWDLFYNILWAELTNHVKFENKQSVYDDECKFLSFLAYQMQIRNKQSMTFDELTELIPSIQKLSFYTDIFGAFSNNYTVTPDMIWIHLKHVAQNVGIVETIESTKTVTIPIRSYQEFLAAYACCNLCLTDGELSPNPVKLLEPYINDGNWLGVIGFAIAGMECNEFANLDTFLSSLYSTADSLNSLCALMDIDYSTSREAAKSLCRVKLKKYELGKDEKLLIEKCMKSRSAFSFQMALNALHRDAFKEGSNMFLAAVSYAYLADSIGCGINPVSRAAKFLASEKGHEKLIGAGLLILVSRIKLDEEPAYAEISESCEATVSGEVIAVLHDLAVETKSYTFVRAITELFISKTADKDTVMPFMDRQLLDIACEHLIKNEDEIKRQMFGMGTLGSDYVEYLKNVINTVGLFPYQLTSRSSFRKQGLLVIPLISAYYDLSFCDMGFINCDTVGIAVCKYHMTGSFDDFIASWVEDICSGRESCKVRNDLLTEREKRHFMFIRESISQAEKDYLSKKNPKLNRLAGSYL